MTRRWSLHVTGFVLGCLLAAGLLGGCSAEQEASDSLPSSSAAPTTEEALPPLGPEDLPMPDEARTQDAAGAEAFVRYYIELINRTSETLESQPLLEFSRGCAECERIAQDANRDAAAGYSYEGGVLTVLEVGQPLVGDGTAEIPLRVALAELVVVDSAGQPVPDLSFGAYPDLLASAAMEWDERAMTWLVTQLDLG